MTKICLKTMLDEKKTRLYILNWLSLHLILIS